MDSDIKLVIDLKNKRPVDLIDLTGAYMGFADEYRRFIARNNSLIPGDDVRLYIKEIRSGSIITDLVALSAVGLPFAEHAKTIVGFMDYIKSSYNFLTGASDNKPQLDKSNLNNLCQFIEPVAKDNASQINFITVINGKNDDIYELTSLQAKAAQTVARREIEKIKEPVAGYHEKVLLYWYQARNDLATSTGDKAIVESISKASVKTVFGKPEIKAKMLLEEQNPFTSAYLVDVYAETVNDRPALYKIIEYYEKLPLSDI